MMILVPIPAMSLLIHTLLLTSALAWGASGRLPIRLRNQRASFSLRAANGDPVSSLPLMEAELAALNGLQTGTAEERSLAALNGLETGTAEERSELEGRIDDAKIAAEFGVRRAQDDFYSAFSRGDLEAMGNVWSAEKRVRVVHPGMSSIEGRDAIMTSWAQILTGGDGGFNISPAETQIEISGQVAMCSCTEETPGGGKLEALNIYIRENGSWKMILHHASPIMM